LSPLWLMHCLTSFLLPMSFCNCSHAWHIRAWTGWKQPVVKHNLMFLHYTMMCTWMRKLHYLTCLVGWPTVPQTFETRQTRLWNT
jgi:hypothetical protein